MIPMVIQPGPAAVPLAAMITMAWALAALENKKAVASAALVAVTTMTTTPQVVARMTPPPASS